MTVVFRLRTLFLPILFLAISHKTHADPELVFNAGLGIMSKDANTFEISEWIHLRFLDRLFNIWHGQGAWLGFSQGYLNGDKTSWYSEIQTKVWDFGSYPLGVSYGNLYFKDGQVGNRASIWLGATIFALAWVAEWGGPLDSPQRFIGLYIKYPICLYGCGLIPGH
jgi:hypothetical protein